MSDAFIVLRDYFTSVVICLGTRMVIVCLSNSCEVMIRFGNAEFCVDLLIDKLFFVVVVVIARYVIAEWNQRNAVDVAFLSRHPRSTYPSIYPKRAGEKKQIFKLVHFAGNC